MGLKYTKTENAKMAYNQDTCDEFSDIDDLVDDANREIITLQKKVKSKEVCFFEHELLKEKLEKVNNLVSGIVFSGRKCGEGQCSIHIHHDNIYRIKEILKNIEKKQYY